MDPLGTIVEPKNTQHKTWLSWNGKRVRLESVKHCERRKSSESNRKSNTRLTAQDESKTALSVGSPVLAGAATQEQHKQAEQQHSKSVVSREALARALRALAGRLRKGRGLFRAETQSPVQSRVQGRGQSNIAQKHCRAECRAACRAEAQNREYSKSAEQSRAQSRVQSRMQSRMHGRVQSRMQSGTQSRMQHGMLPRWYHKAPNWVEKISRKLFQNRSKMAPGPILGASWQ